MSPNLEVANVLAQKQNDTATLYASENLSFKRGAGQFLRKFSATQINWGLCYAKLMADTAGNFCTLFGEMITR